MSAPTKAALIVLNNVSYSVDGAAKAIGISPATVWKLIKAREIKTFKLGHRTLIRADVLAEFIDRRSAA